MILKRVFVAFLLTSSLGSTASAQSHVRLSGGTDLSVNGNYLFGYDNTFGFNSNPISVGPVGGTVTSGLVSLTAISETNAQFASTHMLGAYSLSSIDNPQNNGPLFLKTASAAAFRDKVTWNGPGPAPDTLRFNFEVHGSLTAAQAGSIFNSANANFTFYHNESSVAPNSTTFGTAAVTFSVSQQNPGGLWSSYDSGNNTQGIITNFVHGGGPGGDEFNVNIQIDYNRVVNSNTFDIALTIGASTSVGVIANSSAFATADLAHTATLSTITLFDGTVVTSDQISFSDGFIYTPVPEPTTILGVSGLFLVGAVRFRSRFCAPIASRNHSGVGPVILSVCIS